MSRDALRALTEPLADHASYVDGIDQKRQYALAQVPYNALTAADFHRLLAQLKPDVVVVLMPRAADECK